MSERLRARWHVVDGRRVRVLEAGTGPALVVVHGLGLSGSFWAPHVPTLAGTGLRVIAPDLPAFGKSEGPWHGMSVDETSAWLLALADAIGVESAAWLGHSIAAQAVLDVAVRAPDRARALVLATPTGAPRRWRLLHQWIAFARDLHREPLSLIPAVAREYIRGSPLAFFGTWIRAARDHPLEKATRVRCPTLVVHGRRDPIVPRSFADELCRRIPTARLITLPGASHGVVHDHGEVFDRVVVRFLQACA